VVRPTPLRTVHRADALEWLLAHRAEAGTSVVTSLPDVSELGLGQAKWQAWFMDAARTVIEWIPNDGVAIFFQSDIVRGGVWIDKSYLVLRAAEAAVAPLVWHKIVCRSPPGTSTRGRASYSHLLCFARSHPPPSTGASPDVLPDAGFMPSKKAMGVDACRLACEFLRDHTPTRLVVDPFCGQGTLLAVANALGFDAVGVDRNARCCSAARKLVLGA
jgi:hypothetical protein